MDTSMKATAKDKKYYFALRDEIHAHYLDLGSDVGKEGLHEYLKKLFCDYEGIKNLSLRGDVDKQTVANLCEFTKQFALEHCGIDLDKDDGTQFSDEFYHS